MRIFKITAWLLGGIVALLAVGVALIALLFDPNDYKRDIEQLVAEKTGRTLTLSGDLKLSIFPWLAVEVGPAALGNAKGFGDKPMLSIEHARLGVRLRPLLSGRFEIDAVQLDAPHIVLIKNATGGNNWSDLSKQDNTESAETTQSSHKLNASVASVKIRNGLLSYDDRTAGTQINLRDFDLSTGKLEPGQPFDFDSSFKLQRGADMNLDTQVSANITVDTDNSRYQLNRPTITLLLKGPHFPQQGLTVNLKANSIVADLTAQTAQASALVVDAAGATFTGELQATQIVDAPHFNGSIKLAQLSARELATKLAIDLPKTADPQTLKRLSMEAGLSGSATAFELKPFTMHLDETTLTGSAGIADLDTMALRFDLSVDQINLDRYLSPEDKSAPTTAGVNTAPTPIPADSIRDLNVRGKLAINSLIISKVPLTQLHIGIDANNNKLQLNPLQATLYEGKYRGNVTLDAGSKLPQLSLEQHLDDINFAPLFAALFDTKRVSGRGNTNMQLTAVGADTAAMKKTLNGTLDFKVNNGAVAGIDIWYEIRRARALLKQQAIPTRTGPEQTDFTSLSGSGVITNGQLNNKDLVAAMQYLKVTGQGTVNLVSDVVDYGLNATVLKIPAEDKLADQTQDLAGLTIPVRITGTFSKLNVRPDVAGLLKEQAKQRIEVEKQKLEEKVKDKLKEKLRGWLGG